jgi:dihydrofolate reductase
MTISLIVAVADNGVIGHADDPLPWRQSADLRRYRAITTGHPIIMGRKTYETIGKPLPDRTNIIVSRNPAYTAEGCTITTSIEAALQVARDTGTDEAFIIGGGALFAATLSLVEKLYITEVHAQPEGDTYFRFDARDWVVTQRQDYEADEKNQYPYSFVDYVRK